MKPLKLYNTLSKKKETFTPLIDKKVKLYACGVTPYDNAHIGHGRSYVYIDVLVRLLRFLGYQVTYVRNVTDIDDKLLIKAEKAGDVTKFKEIADKFTREYQQEMEQLNCVIPDEEPRVTDNIDHIIAFIQGLIDTGNAYVVGHDVYFDVSTYKEYGQLSGKKLEDLIAGARVDVNEAKKDPADFALWKGNDEQLFWKSPWGYGRPGWHIECSVLAKTYLGQTIDIHCGGADLIFPHHENERAQSEALHQKTFANIWAHNALLNIDKQKMSKSIGNILSLHEIFEKYDPMILRFYFLQHHYRKSIDFSFAALDAAATAYKKLATVFGTKKSQDQEKLSLATCEQSPILSRILDALCDDVNTPQALGILFEHLSDIKADASLRFITKQFLQEVLGLIFREQSQETQGITPEIQALIDEREAARKAKDWARADEIREQLQLLGVMLRDKKL